MPSDEAEYSRITEDEALTLDELIRSQLRGKSNALKRYDQSLWRVRSGYVIVQYGLLTILAHQDYEFSGVIGSVAAIEIGFWMSFGLSACALLIDLKFLGSRMLVVEARDLLSDLALEIATRSRERDQIVGELRALLRLPGEGQLRWTDWLGLLKRNWAILTMYAVTPSVLAFVWWYRMEPLAGE